MKRVKLEHLNFLIGRRREVTQFVLRKIGTRQSFILLPTSLNDLAAASGSQKLLAAYRQVDFCVTDGMPLVWFFRGERVYGPTLMKNILGKNQGGTKHFFYGSTAQTLAKLTKNLKDLVPQTRVVGKIAPPFRPLTKKEEVKYLAQIRHSRANVLWIGLSSPKQVELAARWQRFLPGVSIMCVGAAFDFLAGKQVMAPSWVQKNGWEWLFRFLVEPKRLWHRYLVTIPGYLLKKAFSNLVRILF